MTGSMIHNIHAWPGVYTTPKACFSHVKDGQLLHRKHVSLRNTISITVIKFSVFVQDLPVQKSRQFLLNCF